MRPAVRPVRPEADIPGPRSPSSGMAVADGPAAADDASGRLGDDDRRQLGRWESEGGALDHVRPFA